VKKPNKFIGMVGGTIKKERIISDMMEEFKHPNDDDCYGLLGYFALPRLWLDEYVHNEEDNYNAQDLFCDMVRSIEMINYNH
jgi:hypothetical protein